MSDEQEQRTLHCVCSGAPGIPQIQQLPPHTHHRVSRRRRGRSAAQRGQLRGGADHRLHQVPAGRLHVSSRP